MVIFTIIGMVTTGLALSYFLMEILFFLSWKFRKRCFQCGKNSDRTYRIGDSYYCRKCIESDNITDKGASNL